MDIKGTTKIIGIFGYPITHTLSPVMHNAIFKFLGLDYCYIPFEVRKGYLSDAVKALRALNIKGINVTIPYKEEIIPYLDEISSEARIISAVNTVSVRKGRLIGYNTDGRGFIKAFYKESGLTLRNKKILLLGAGGAAKAVAVQAALMGTKEILIANRTFYKGKELAGHISRFVPTCRVIPLKYTKDTLKKSISRMDILINATSLGMNPKDPLPIPQDLLHPSLVVYDLIYNPPITGLLKAARKVGAKGINGVGMLLYQGALSFEIWTGVRPPIDLMKRVLTKALRSSNAH